MKEIFDDFGGSLSRHEKLELMMKLKKERYSHLIFYNGGQKSLEQLWKTLFPHP